MIIGKQIILPVLGILSTIFLKEFVLDMPPEISGAFYLVIVIVFLTPTANNVMVMVELSGNSTDAFAKVIALQYALAPILLSLTLTSELSRHVWGKMACRPSPDSPSSRFSNFDNDSCYRCGERLVISPAPRKEYNLCRSNNSLQFSLFINCSNIFRVLL